MTDHLALKKVLCLVVALGAFAVAGCGGGGSSVVGGGSESVSGVVADGYLENATVFLDLNDDKQFAEGEEPTAVTDVNGKYTLKDVAAADLKEHAIVVLAEQGVTINHEESGSTPVAAGYILSTPPDAPKDSSGQVVITPLTTLIHSQMETNPALKVAEAEAAVKADLGLAAGTGLFEDFVQKKGASEDYLKVSRVAQVVAAAIGNNMAAIQEAAPTANLNDIIKVIVAEVIRQLPGISNVVDTIATENFDAATIATASVTVNTDDSDALKDSLSQASAPAAVGSFEKALGTDGFFWIEHSNNDYMQSAYYEYGVVKLGALGATGYALTEENYIYTSLNPTWVADADDSASDNYVLTKDGWTLTNDNASAGTLVFNQDGTATWTIAASGQSEVISVSKIDVAQKPIGSYISRENAPFKADAVFPAGAEAYKMTFVAKSDRYSVWSSNYPNSALAGMKAVTEIPAAFAAGGTERALYIGNNFSVKFTVTGTAGTGTTGTAQFYAATFQNTSPFQVLEPLTLKGSWKIVEPVAGYQVFVLDVPSVYKAQYMYDDASEKLIFASVNGALQQGSVEYANVPKVESELNFNKIAFDAIKANFNPSWSLSGMLPKR